MPRKTRLNSLAPKVKEVVQEEETRCIDTIDTPIEVQEPTCNVPKDKITIENENLTLKNLELENRIKDMNITMNTLKSDNVNLRNEKLMTDVKIKQLNKEIELKNNQISSLNSENIKLLDQIKTFKSKTNEEYEKEKNKMIEENKKFSDIISEQNKTINQLKDHINRQNMWYTQNQNLNQSMNHGYKSWN